LRRKVLLPTDASVENWFWLSLSGLVGFVFGDLFLFKSYTVIGSRFSMLIMTLLRRWSRVKAATHDIKGMKSLTLGAFFGPFLGVSFSLLSVKFTKTGIASTIMALVPVFILIPAIFMYKQKVTIPEIIGSIISVCGVALFFL
jgi:drug/metabolite transporter (DMT)-like permease